MAHLILDLLVASSSTVFARRKNGQFQKARILLMFGFLAVVVASEAKHIHRLPVRRPA
jgi:hypothetical protein